MALLAAAPEGDIVDLYTTLPWPTLCDEVAKLRIHLADPQKAPAGPVEASAAAPEGSSSPLATSQPQESPAAELQTTAPAPEAHAPTLDAKVIPLHPAAHRGEASPGPSHLRSSESATIGTQLAATLTQWLITGNRDELRRALMRVLQSGNSAESEDVVEGRKIAG